jgi:hypothetical protein
MATRFAKRVLRLDDLRERLGSHVLRVAHAELRPYLNRYCGENAGDRDRDDNVPHVPIVDRTDPYVQKAVQRALRGPFAIALSPGY